MTRWSMCISMAMSKTSSRKIAFKAFLWRHCLQNPGSLRHAWSGRRSFVLDDFKWNILNINGGFLTLHLELRLNLGFVYHCSIWYTIHHIQYSYSYLGLPFSVRIENRDTIDYVLVIMGRSIFCEYFYLLWKY